MRALLLLLFCIGWVDPIRADGDNVLVEAGIPALSREWAGDDYAQTVSVLAAGKIALPLLSIGDGPAFFQRLTSTENLSFYRNQTLPSGQRLENYLKLVGGINAITKQYLAAADKGAKVHREVTLQLVFLLRVAVAGTQMVDEFMQTVPKDEKYPARVEGLKKMGSGLTSIFAGAVTSLGETSFYSPEDLSLLLGGMAETLPAMKKSFTSDYQVELRKKLEQLRTTFPKPTDRQNLQKMLDALKA